MTLSHNQRRWLLLGMLALLHLLLIEGIFTPVGRLLLVAHLGVFILWQPFVRAEMRLSPSQLATVGALVALAAWQASHWLMILWVMALAGILGGKVFFFARRGAKLLYLLILAYLICVLVLVLVPRVLPTAVDPSFDLPGLALLFLPILFPLMALLPVEPESAGAEEVVDFVYSAFIFLLLAVLVLGSTAGMLIAGHGYFESLVTTVMVFGAVLLLMAWIWNPRLGFSGVGTFFSRYMLSLGLPFERWLHELADNMQREDRPEAFLSLSLEAMSQLPWVNGCDWRTPESHGSFGQCVGESSAFHQGTLALTIFSKQPLSPVLNWHFNLLAQLLGEFYEAKLRARELQELSYIRAIHQTGARLTHDVKNLLQSLNTLCLAASREGELASPEYQALLRRQLPVIAQRLQQTLDKLRRPEQESGQFVALERWWADLQQRYGHGEVRFHQDALPEGVLIPTALFNSTVENLIENARAKKAQAPALTIEVRLAGDPDPLLRVCDDGAAIDPETLDKLFHAPLPSRTGLGIGLYQAARHAEFYGYTLKVTRNMDGAVCFELASRREEGEVSGEQ